MIQCDSPFILNKNIYADNVLYEYSNCILQSNPNMIKFIRRKNQYPYNPNNQCCLFKWFGWSLEKGYYNISFQYNISAKIKSPRVGLKMHSPEKLITGLIKAKTDDYISYNNTIYLDSDQLVIFIFDEENTYIDFKVKNFMAKKIYTNIAICLFGFYRNTNKTLINSLRKSLDSNIQDLYIASPIQRYENTIEMSLTELAPDDCITEDYLRHEYCDFNLVCSLWNYSKIYFMCQIPQCHQNLNMYKQSAWRVLSQFYHIHQSLKLALDYENPNKPYTMIILTRCEFHIKYINPMLLVDKNNQNKIIVREIVKDNFINDWIFIIPRIHVNNVLSIYTNCIEYFDYLHNRPYSWAPEAIWAHHLNCVGNDGIDYSEISDKSDIDIEYNHVCSQYCGHNM